MDTISSEDHRGTPEAPGRVVTLIDRAHWETLSDHHNPTEKVWGAAYHIPSEKVPEVREYLDIREINGYSIQFTPFHPASFTTSISTTRSPTPEPPSAIIASTTIHAQPESSSGPTNCLVYIGLPENPQFLGPQDPHELAKHILKSKGPSGENRDYLYMLEKALLELSPESGDGHVSDLVQRCRDLETLEGSVEVGEEKGVIEGGKVGAELHKVGSTEEQEEVEK